MNASLVFDKVSAFYGTSQILHDVTFEVPSGTVTCLLGLNGMGKTTTLRAAMGLVDRQEGRIALNGRELAGHTYERAQMGITLVPEDRKVFAGLTVLENLEVAKRRRDPSSDFTINEALETFPRLGERLKQKAWPSRCPKDRRSDFRGTCSKLALQVPRCRRWSLHSLRTRRERRSDPWRPRR